MKWDKNEAAAVDVARDLATVCSELTQAAHESVLPEYGETLTRGRTWIEQKFITEGAYRKDQPAAPGFYWLLDDAGVEQVVEVEHNQEQQLVAYYPGDGNGWCTLAQCRAVGWAGPLGKPRRA